MNFFQETLSFLSPLPSDPLFSTIVALYTLILLYLPRPFLGVVFSPVVISAGIVLLTLLRLGATQRIGKEFNSTEAKQIHDSADEDHKWVSCETNSESKTETGLGFDLDPFPFYADSFVEWNVGAPLEVIYEEYEGEDHEENDDVPNEKEEMRVVGLERYPSLSLYYPESDSDDSSEGEFPAIEGWDSPESMRFRWDEEDRDGLIEIALDGKRTSEVMFRVDEDNLIEIDISPGRNDEFAGDQCIQELSALIIGRPTTFPN
ncbi:hypothetical protein F0562_019011 [Nyssa sinensis]|uniref:Uncharacterized protein n=1 Tax=Nyssa sinensis TaxID=561372 RepID=A0A5J4ZCS8_9ASTE|nr:hypothetical protein F0562_019011 [Nyssa sinensis]